MDMKEKVSVINNDFSINREQRRTIKKQIKVLNKKIPKMEETLEKVKEQKKYLENSLKPITK